MTNPIPFLALVLSFIVGITSTAVAAGSNAHADHDMHKHGHHAAGHKHETKDEDAPRSHDQGHAGMARIERALTSAEVITVDSDQRRLTLKHERIESLDMPGMTMPFPVAPEVDLGAIRPGDQIHFGLKAGSMMINQIEAGKHHD